MNKIEQILKHQGFRKYFSNTSWLFATQGVRLFTGLFVGLLLARYLGPEKYGTYNYVIAIITVVMSFTRFGTDDQVVKDLILFPEKKTNLLSEGFYLRFFLSLISILGCLLFYLVSETKEQEYKFLLICSVGLIFQSFEVIDLAYRASVQLKISSFFRISQVILSSLLKVYFIYTKSDLVSFFYVFVFDGLSYSIPLYYIYRKKEDGFLLKKVRFGDIYKLANKSFPLMIATTGAILLSKLDQIMVAQVLGLDKAGYYTAANKLIEITSLIPTLIMMSLFTAMMTAKRSSRSLYLQRYRQLSKTLIWFSIIATAIIYFTSLQLIQTLYSEKYSESVSILQQLSIQIVPITLMLLNTKWFIAEDKNIIVMYKTIGAILTSWILCFILIPKYGYTGAVIATCFTHTFFFLIIDLFFIQTREVFYINISFLNIRRLFT